MKLTVRVDVDGMYFSGGACAVVPEMLVQAFAPLRTCSEPVVAAVFGEVYDKSETFRTTVQLRKDATEILANELTKLLLSEMRKMDTHNGYTKTPNEPPAGEGEKG